MNGRTTAFGHVKLILPAILLLFVAVQYANAACSGTCYYVRSGAGGTGSGADWNNAYTSLPSTLVRGATYYVASGSYPGRTFSTATSGTTYITIQKATDANHGADTGWVTNSGSYGVGQAVFTSQIAFTTNYWIFNGSVGGGPGDWTGSVTPYGFKVEENSDIQVINIDPAAHVTLAHFESVGNPGAAGGSGTGNDGVGIYASAGYITVEYSYIHDTGRCIIYSRASNLLFQYIYTGNYTYLPSQHSELFSMWGAGYPLYTNVTIRYNIFTYIQGTGGLMLGGSNYYIYGNVWYDAPGVYWNWGHGNGLIGAQDGQAALGNNLTNIYVHDNSFINAGGVVYGSYLKTSQTFASDNLYYGTVSLGQATTGTGNLQTSAAGLITNPAGLDFTLTSDAQGGTNLGSPYNVDPLGNVRTTWTAGAYQYEGAGSTTIPTTTSATTSIPTTTSSTTTTTPTTSMTTIPTTIPTTSTTTSLVTTTTMQQSSILHTVQITFTNSQSSPTPSPFQSLVSINPQSYSTYEAADLGNIRFMQGAATLFSWCESGCTSGSSAAVFWVRLPNGIAANSNLVVNMSFMSTGAQYEYDSNAGEAPQLSTSYGQYDNGKSVFNIYTNSNLFASSTAPPGWTATANCDGVSGIYCVYNNSQQALPVVTESYGRYLSGSGSYINFPILMNSGRTVFGGVGNNAGTTSIYIRDVANGAAAVLTSYTTNNNIYTYTAASASSESAQLNYGASATDSYSFGSATLYAGISSPLNSGAVVWFRSRAYPPNGVMPPTNIGGVTTTTTTPTTTIGATTSTSTTTSSTTSVTTTIVPLTVPTKPTVSATSLDGGQTVTFSTYVANGLSPYTYNFILSNPGTGSVAGFSAPQSSNSFAFTTSSAGTFHANVVVSDSEAPSVTKNSTYSLNFKVKPGPHAKSPKPSASTITLGQSVTFSVNITNGTGPFTLELVGINGTVANIITAQGVGNLTFAPVTPLFNMSSYNVIGVDTGTDVPFVFNSTYDTVIVIGAPPSTTSTSTTTVSTTTIETTTVPNQGGNPGGPGGPTGTGGSLKPTATLSGSCYNIVNMTALKGTNVTLNGTFIGLVTNFIGPSSAGVTVNNVSYTLAQGALQTLFNQSDRSYTIELKTVTYLPIIHAIQVKVCSTSPPSANSTSRVLLINNSGSVSTLPITSNQVTTNIGFWPGKVAVSVSNIISNTVYLRLNNATSANSVPQAPEHYTKDFAINVSASSNTTIFLTLGYSCAINHTRVAPFLLNGSGWRIITPFTTNPSLCTVSFVVPNDPVVALMVQNQTQTGSTNTTIQQGQGGGKASGTLTVYEVAVAAIGVVVFVALLLLVKRKRQSPPETGLEQKQEQQAPPEPQENTSV